MSKDLIKSSIEDIRSLNNIEKENLDHYCNIAFKYIEKVKRTSDNIVIDLGNKDGYKRELVRKRIRKNNYPTSIDKLKIIGLAETNREKLAEKINKGEINSNHINNIVKADIDNALAQLPPKKQEKVIERIIENTNEKTIINREEIASESIQNGNINLMIVESWYKGIIRSSNQLESKLYIDEEVLEFLSKDQLEELYERISRIARRCSEFINSLNL